MKRKILSMALALVLLAMVVTPAFAAVWEALIYVSEHDGNDQPMLGYRHPLNTPYLVNYNFISASGLNSSVGTAVATAPYMLCDDKLFFVTDLDANGTDILSFSTGIAPPLAAFDIIPGNGGYITIADAAALELGNVFELEQEDAYVDVSATAVGSYLINKLNSFWTYVSAATDITSEIWQPTGAWTQRAPQLNAQIEINGLAVFNNTLYGCTGNSGRLFEWNGTNAWIQVAPTFVAANDISDLAVYDSGAGEHLYGSDSATGNLLEWNGVNAWVSVAPQLGAEVIRALAVYDSGAGDHLYGCTGPNGNLYEWNDVNAWVSVAAQLGAETVVTSLEVYDSGAGEHLYGGTAVNGLLYEWNDVNLWVSVAPQLNAQTVIWSLEVYDSGAGEHLYGGTAGGGRLFEWNDVNAWVEVAPQLVAENAIRSLVEYNDILWGGTNPNGNLYYWNDVNAWVQAAPQGGAEITILSLEEYNDNLYGGTGNLGNLFEFTPTILSVTAAGLTTGIMDVITLADGVDFEIYIDGALEGTIPLGGVSVHDNTAPWDLMDNSTVNFMPHMDYYRHSVGGVLIAHYEPITYILGTALPDRAGAAQDGAFVFGPTNPTGVTVTMLGLNPVDAYAGADEPLVTPDALGELTEPTGMFPAADVPEDNAWNIPFTFLPFLEVMTSTPTGWFGVFLAALIVLILMGIMARQTGNLWLTGLAMNVGIGIGVAMGAWDPWFLILGVMMAVGVAVMEKSPTL